MYEFGFWGDCAKTMELANEGNRLIAQEIGAGVKALWRRTVQWLDESLQGLGQRRHLPPI